jgi:AbrB family looped-hinge helix DNA binding protein
VLVLGRANSYLTYVLPVRIDNMAAPQATTVVSTKGQVILPKAIRDKRHWQAGTRLEVQG